MKQLFLPCILTTICFASGTTAIQAQSMGSSFRTPLFYDHRSCHLDVQAKELLKKHLQHMEETNSPEIELLPMMSGMALLLRDSERDQAISLFKKCLAIREKLGDKSSDEYKNELEGYAEAAFHSGDPQTAEDLLGKLIPLATEYDVKHKLKFDLVECYTDEKNYARAEHLMLATIKQNEAVAQCFSNELLGVAQWYTSQKRFDEAKPWFLKAIAKAKAENDLSGARKAELAMLKFFVKENKPADVTALLKKSPPQITLSENGGNFLLGGEGGISYGLGFGSSDDEELGKKNMRVEEEWIKQYRLALKKLNQKNYAHAETLFKEGSLKYKGAGEAVLFDLGLAKTYQETKNQQKLRDVISAMVKSYGNGNPLPIFRPRNGAVPTKQNSKESKPI